LSLQADLVVLSACESGLGAEQAGEGVMSLSRAFAQAGAASLVGTLWSVNDRASADLCGKFYQQLAEKQSISAALCTAKRAYLSDNNVPATRQSPYFWAGLVQVGTDRVVAPEGGWSWWWVVGIVVAAALIGAFLKTARRGNNGHADDAD
jgi:CHAT domain-containing protein